MHSLVRGSDPVCRTLRAKSNCDWGSSEQPVQRWDLRGNQSLPSVLCKFAIERIEWDANDCMLARDVPSIWYTDSTAKDRPQRLPSQWTIACDLSSVFALHSFQCAGCFGNQGYWICWCHEGLHRREDEVEEWVLGRVLIATQYLLWHSLGSKRGMIAGWACTRPMKAIHI